MKSYTDLNQSKRLAEILPIKSTDGYYWKRTWKENDYAISVGHSKELQEGFESKCIEYIPCWSLAALFDILPKFIGDYGKCLYYDVGGYYCGYMDDGNFMLTIKEANADNPVDACYDMIIKLHELKLL